jgi:transcriptional regulator with XRE-family HTH domain
VLAGSLTVTVQGPTVVRRQLGSRLRRLREEAGQTINSVASAKVFSTSKMIRIEGGKIEVKAGDVWTLCRFYGVTDPAVIDALAELADGTGERGWWEDNEDRVAGWLALYLGLEEGVDELLVWQPELVPGLLQTAAYADAVLREGGIDDVGRALQLRLARQRRFFERGTPLRAVLGPATLHLEVGDAATAAAQRRHLIQLAGSQRADVRILPWSAGAHVGMTGGFTIFGFDSDADPSAVYLETLVGGRYMESPGELARYRAAFARLWEQSVPIEEQVP